MIRQETIARISLLAAITGMAGLFLADSLFEEKEVRIGDIDESLVEWKVKFNAQVLSSYQKGETIFLQLYDGTGKIKAVWFNTNQDQLKLVGKNSFASFSGKVKIYEEELELVVETVEEWH